MSAAYQLTSGSAVVRTSDGACIPSDLRNVDYQTYLVWAYGQQAFNSLVSAGANPPDVSKLSFVNTPDPYVATAVVPSFLARDLLAQLTSDDYTAIQTAIGSNAALGLLWASLL